MLAAIQNFLQAKCITNELTKYKGLGSQRTCFAMTIFNGKPIVIGGIIDTRPTNSVEIFENGSWVSFHSLILNKSHPKAIENCGFLYVFSGVASPYRRAIEKYSGRWMILSVKMQLGVKNFGLCINPSGIMIFGGENKQGYSHKVYCFSNSEKFSIVNELKDDLSAIILIQHFMMDPHLIY